MFEKNYEPKSELRSLLEKKLNGDILSTDEVMRGTDLINNPVFSKEECEYCKETRIDTVAKAIYDTGFCKFHAYVTLISR